MQAICLELFACAGEFLHFDHLQTKAEYADYVVILIVLYY